MAQIPQRDAIDIALRQNVSEQPGCSISTAIDPLRLERSETVLRARVWQMVRRGEIGMEREKHVVKLYVEGDEL